MEIISETLEKSCHNKNSYQLIKLRNALKVLLVSEPNTANNNNPYDDLLVCSLNIAVGLSSDPKDIPGLAHFVGRVIVSDSNKWPAENDQTYFYTDSYIDLEETSFTTNFLRNNSETPLDKFSQFFKQPIMSMDSVTKERETISSEFTANVYHNISQLNRFLSTLVQPDHSYHLYAKFPVPNNITDNELYEKANEFRKHHYSAHRMQLCLHARMTLDELQALAVKYFSDIPNNELAPNDLPALTHENVFVENFYDKVFLVDWELDSTLLNIFWCFPTSLQNYKCRSLAYVSCLFQHEDEGSLVHYLRKKQWTDSVSFDGAFNQNSVFSMLRVFMLLTEQGISDIDKVIEAILSYVRFLKHVGPNEHLFKEIQSIAASSFQYPVAEISMDNVEVLASKMRKYPPEHILTANQVYMEYDPKAIQNVFDHLNTDKFNITITTKPSQLKDDSIKFNLKKGYLEIEYYEGQRPGKWVDMWNKAKPFEDFHLPELNPYIADDFTLFYDKSTVLPKHPVKIMENDVSELWHRQDDKFLLPHVSFHFYFMSPIIKSSTKNSVLLELYTSVLCKHLTSKLFFAQEAKLPYYLYNSDLGLLLYGYGFNQKLHLVLDDFVKSLKTVASSVTEDEFSVFIKNCTEDHMKSSKYSLSFAYGMAIYLSEHHNKSLYEKAEALKSLRFVDFQEFCHEFLKEMRIKCLIQGNVTEASAKNIMKNILTELNPEQIKDEKSIELNATKMPIRNTYLRCNGSNFSDTATLVVNFYQIGTATHRNKALVELFSDISRKPACDILCSKDQLAKWAQFELWKSVDIIGYSIHINLLEHKFSAEYIDDRIENLRQELISILRNVSDEDLEKSKQSLMEYKTRKDWELDRETQRNWTEIMTGAYIFDRAEREVEALKAITKEELLEFYVKYLNDENRKLSIQIIGNANGSEVTTKNEATDEICRSIEALSIVDFTTPKPDAYLIQDIAEYKKTLEVYPKMINAEDQ